MINNLRYLVDIQQFEELNKKVKEFYEQTQDISLLPLLALSYIHQKEYKRAFEYCELCEAQKEKLDDDALVDLAGVYALLHKVDDAINLLEPIIQKDSNHSLALARLAWCRWQEDNISESIKLYEDSLTLNQNRIPVYSGLAKLYLEQKQLSNAQKTLENGLEQLEVLKKQMPKDAIELFENQFEELQLNIWIVDDNQKALESWLVNQKNLEEKEYITKVLNVSIAFAYHNKHDLSEQILIENLKKYPKNQELILQLSSLANIQGHTMQEVNLLKKAIKIGEEDEKPTVNLWVKLSSAYLHNQTDLAKKAVEKAQELSEEMSPSDDFPQVAIEQLKLQVKTALANVENQLLNYDEADRLFTEVLDENPYLVNALQGYGSQLMQLGKMDEAIELYERLKQVDPLQGVSALINARKFPEDKETLIRMEKLASKPTLEGEMRSGILFQLASAWEKLKEYDKAFEVLTKANETSKQHLNYSSKNHRQECARLRYAFSKELYKHRPNYGDSSSMSVFVLGMPRSGTTLIEQIIASHSKIFGAGELGIIPSRIGGLNRWEKHTGSGRVYPDIMDDLDEKTTKGIAQGILDELNELKKDDKPDAKYVVDKLPHNFENIGFIKFLFPNAKIISVRRDSRDIAISNYFQNFQAKHGGMGFAYDLEWIGEQLADHNLLMQHWHEIFPNEILEINYEDVVNDLGNSAKKMLDYIGVEWEDGVLEYTKLNRAVKTASVWQVRQPLYKTAMEKWRRYEKYLKPLITGTNKKIKWEPIQMLTLPEAGFVTKAADLYKEGNLKDAELNCKKMLHHNSEHAAAHYILGLIYLSSNIMEDGITELEMAVRKVPWQKEWRDNLKRAYAYVGEPERLKKFINSLKEESIKNEMGN